MTLDQGTFNFSYRRLTISLQISRCSDFSKASSLCEVSFCDGKGRSSSMPGKHMVEQGLTQREHAHLKSPQANKKEKITPISACHL